MDGRGRYGDSPSPGRSVRLHTFPSDDDVFRAYVEGTSAAAAEEGPLTPDRLRSLLRQRYPAAAVRAQQAFASNEAGAPPVWYVFRFGAIAPAASQAPEGWSGPDVAWAIMDDERRFLDLSPSLAAIVEVEREQMLDRRVDDFVNPEDPTMVEDLRGLWERFLAAGSAESTIRFNHADGRPRQLAYRIRADDAGPGRHRLLVRVVDES